MTNTRYCLRFLLLFTVLLFVGCSGGQAEYFLKSLSNKYYGIPFDKERITELRIRYWIKVREGGTYDGVFDTGIRKRVLSITDYLGRDRCAAWRALTNLRQKRPVTMRLIR